MIFNFNDIELNQYNVDICIVGSGAAGLTCALEFEKTDYKVLIIEAGLEKFNESISDSHKGFVIGKYHAGFYEARERIFGGTTTKWGGQLLEFLEEDFEKRSWVNYSGWPLKFSDLENYYKRAYKLLEISNFNNLKFDPWKKLQVNKIKFTKRLSFFENKVAISDSKVLEYLPILIDSDRHFITASTSSGS